MSSIKISNLQPTESELIELSNLELDGIVGGSVIGDLLKKALGITETPKELKELDDTVRILGGWRGLLLGSIR